MNLWFFGEKILILHEQWKKSCYKHKRDEGCSFYEQNYPKEKIPTTKLGAYMTTYGAFIERALLLECDRETHDRHPKFGE